MSATTVGAWTVDDDTREWVAANVAAAPPLTNEQRTKLAELLAPVRRHTMRDERANAAASLRHSTP
jgi:hypothetical protein